MSSPIIKVENFSFKYHESDNYTIKNININFNKGEYICITGPSGGGKSTLALALCGFIPHTIAGEFKGQIILQDFETSRLSLAEISQFIGLVQQDPENQIVTPTVIEEIAFGPENLSLTRQEILNRVNLSARITELSSLLYRSTNELSGGEKQRVAISSILSMQPEVIVFDEPTAFLDRFNIQNLLSALSKLNKDKKMTIIIIEHQPQVFKDYIDRLIVIEHGTIIKDLNKQEIDYSPYIVPKEMLKSIQMIKTDEIHQDSLVCTNLKVCIKDRTILSNISSIFKQGLIYGIIGPNGAGKTTFLMALINLISKKEGIVTYLGRDITRKETFLLAKEIGLVFQNPNHQLFERTVMDEVLFAPKNFGLDLQIFTPKAKAILTQSSLDQYLDKLPFSLSYGEKRRLTICSMEIYQPSILLLDEPFIGQDRKNIEYLLKILKERKLKCQTTIIVSHRDSFLFELVDYMLIINNGEIVTQGFINDLSKTIDLNDLIYSRRTEAR